MENSDTQITLEFKGSGDAIAVGILCLMMAIFGVFTGKLKQRFLAIPFVLFAFGICIFLWSDASNLSANKDNKIENEAAKICMSKFGDYSSLNKYGTDLYK